MNEVKISFFKNQFLPLLEKIPFDKKPEWGTMTVQQMIEHFADVFRLSSGKFLNKKLVVPEEKIVASQAFLMSDKPFPRGVSNPLLPKDPVPVRNADITNAIAELKVEMDYFLFVLETNKDFKILHPYFGELDPEMNLQSVYKHALHHLNQFGVTV
jgi:oxepin-CoA hydrolase/3-oxo-5,6-dehydrosuberyl-CoA semialdehyde dehydrogenase